MIKGCIGGEFFGHKSPTVRKSMIEIEINGGIEADTELKIVCQRTEVNLRLGIFNESHNPNANLLLQSLWGSKSFAELHSGPY